MTEYLMKSLDAVCVPMPPALKSSITAVLHQLECRKWDYILKPGEICDRMFFVQKGLFRAYEKRETRDITRWFMKEGDFVTSPVSFFKQQPSDENVQALEDAEVFYIYHKDMEQLMQEYQAFLMIYAKLVTEYYCKSVLRENMAGWSAEERYQHFLENFPGLADRLPQTYIASFLRMSQKTLGKQRKRKGN